MLDSATLQGEIRLAKSGSDWELNVGTGGGRLLFPADGLVAAKFLVAAMTYHGEKLLSFHFEFLRERPTGHQSVENPYKSPEYLEFLRKNLIQMTSILPHNRVTVAFDLALLDGNNLRDKRTAGKLRSMIFGNLIRPEEIKAVGLNFLAHHQPQRVTLHELHWSNQAPNPTLDHPVPVVDEMGQLKGIDWPGKTNSVAEMIRQQHEAAAHAAFVRMETPTRSRFGGFKGKRFEASGFFRVQNENGRHFLVDPDGYLFFSMGMDCVDIERYDASARLDGIEGLCQWLPPKEGEFAEAYATPVDGTADGSSRVYFNFALANQIRAHGRDWHREWSKITRGRLIEWGFNTVANWSDPWFIKGASLPYVVMFQLYPQTKRCIFRDFPDVFSPEFRDNAKLYAEQLRPYVGDQLLLGYFMANEPQWGVVQHLNFAKEMFRDATPFASKAKLIDFLAKRYSTVGALNAAWGTSFADFEGVRGLVYEQVAGRIADDLMDFSRDMMREYVRVPAEELRRVDPKHLNLGMRYAWMHSDLLYVGAEHFDVFSTNRYAMYLDEAPHDQLVENILRHTGRPTIIGEFHFGAPDRGCLGAGLKSMKDQTERGKAYRRYVEDAAAKPNLLGLHYFILNDQATLGRFDGEANQIGFVDVAGQPYAEFLDYAKAAHDNIYPLILGEKKPFWCEPMEIPMVF